MRLHFFVYLTFVSVVIAGCSDDGGSSGIDSSSDEIN